MFWEDILLVTEQVEKYGLQTPFASIASSDEDWIADFSLTTATQDQRARFVRLEGRPFDHLQTDYQHLSLEDLASAPTDTFGCIACLGILEQYPDPDQVLQQIYSTMREQATIIIHAAFSYPFRPDTRDLWRFSPEGLALLAARAGFQVLESGWRLQLGLSQNIRHLQRGDVQEIRTAYVTACRGQCASAAPGIRYQLPERHSDVAAANNIIRQETQKPSGSAQRSAIDAPGTIVIISTISPAAMRSIYQQSSHLQASPYREQLATIQRMRFDASAAIAAACGEYGWNAHVVISNAPALDAQWEREHPQAPSGSPALMQQLRKLRPEAVLCLDCTSLSRETLADLRQSTRFLIGMVADFSHDTSFTHFDLLLSPIASVVARFRQQQIRAELMPYAFDSHVLQNIPAFPYNTRSTLCSFVGSIIGNKADRIELLEALTLHTPIEIWGEGRETLMSDSLLKARHHGEVWGLEMYAALGESKVTLNIHPDELYCPDAYNRRLFDATGCGCLLITDYRANLNQQFEIGDEAVAYRGVSECADLIRYYLHHPEEAEAIALAGQARTLRDHTYSHYSHRLIELTHELRERAQWKR